MKAVRMALIHAGINADWDGDFIKISATSSADGSLQTIIKLTLNNDTVTIIVNKKVEMPTSPNTNDTSNSSLYITLLGFTTMLLAFFNPKKKRNTDK